LSKSTVVTAIGGKFVGRSMTLSVKLKRRNSGALDVVNEGR
jgi:hypothetical protein